jgi:hypothetical protein
MSAPDTLEFTFSTSIRFIPVAVTILFLALTIFLFRKRGLRRFGFIPLAIALIAGGLIAPALFRDRVSATATEITTTRGFWFAPSQEDYKGRLIQTIRSELLAELAKATSTTGNPEFGRSLN